MGKYIQSGKPSESEILKIKSDFDPYYLEAQNHAETLINYQSKKGRKTK